MNLDIDSFGEVSVAACNFDDALNDKRRSKANKHLSVRIIAVALLFLAPALITFVLQFFNLNGTGIAGTCNIK